MTAAQRPDAILLTFVFIVKSNLINRRIFYRYSWAILKVERQRPTSSIREGHGSEPSKDTTRWNLNINIKQKAARSVLTYRYHL